MRLRSPLARRNMEAIDHECFEDALARVQLGALRPLVMSERERRIIAYHEGGHALVAYHLPEADTVNRRHYSPTWAVSGRDAVYR